MTSAPSEADSASSAPLPVYFDAAATIATREAALDPPYLEVDASEVIDKSGTTLGARAKMYEVCSAAQRIKSGRTSDTADLSPTSQIFGLTILRYKASELAFGTQIDTAFELLVGWFKSERVLKRN